MNKDVKQPQKHSEISSISNIYSCLEPSNNILFFIGLQNFSYEESKPVPRKACSKAYSFFLFSSLVGLNVFFLFLKIFDELKFFTFSLVVTENIAISSAVLAGVASLGLPLFFNKNLALQYLRNIEHVDQLLNLPTSHYVNMSFRLTGAYILVFLYFNFTIASDFLAWYNPRIYLLSGMYLSMFFVDFMFLQYVIDIWMVAFRLRALNSQLICFKYFFLSDDVDFSPLYLISTEKWDQINTIRPKNNRTNDLGDKILRLRIVYDKLADNVDIINSTYGLQIALALCSSFLGILQGINSVLNMNYFKINDDSKTIIESINWCSHFILLIVIPVMSSESLSNESQKSTVLINKLLLNRNMSKDHILQLSLLDTQLKTRPLILTACNFFTLENGLLYNFVATMATYITILFQMKG